MENKNKIAVIPLQRTNIKDGDLYLYNGKYYIDIANSEVPPNYTIYQFLILSNDEIKDPCFYLVLDSKTIWHTNGINHIKSDNAKKIIASNIPLEGTLPIDLKDIQKWISLGCPDEVELIDSHCKNGMLLEETQPKTNPDGTIVLKWEEDVSENCIKICNKIIDAIEEKYSQLSSTPEKEILEGNKLIAEFDGGIHMDTGYTHFEDKTALAYKTDCLCYHSSYNWLMPVVQKIGKDEKYWNERMYLNHLTIYSPIEEIWKAVVQCINVINKNKDNL